VEARIAARIGALAQGARPFAVCVVAKAHGSVPGKAGATMLVHPDGSTEGTVGGAGLEERVRKAALACLAQGKGDLLTFDLANWKPQGLDSVCGGSVMVAIDVVAPPPHLLLIGGGHCAKALADVCDVLGWRYTVVDARAEFADAQRFPRAVATHGGMPPAEWAAKADLAPYSHLYLLGHDHHLDTATLVAALPRFQGKVGVIGSQAKRQSMFERARKAGIEDKDLARVRCPIGLDIGAETPAEIAVAVAAEVLQQFKNKGDA
jgi:xanthine dehydrogenase accessory factor